MHQLPSYKNFKKQKSKSNYTAFTQLVGGSTAATIELMLAECAFCHDKSKQAFPQMIMKALYQKFAASQNYFYSKDINEILSQSRSKATIINKDYQHYDENDEFLKRFYGRLEYQPKIKMLSEYYKYHYDVPRQFMLPTSLTISKYHDKKRRVAYQRITKMLNIQPELDETDKQDTQINILQQHKSLECLLDQLNDTRTKNNQIEDHHNTHYIIKPSKAPNTLQSESNTLQEINQRLGELIGASSSPINPYFPTNQTNSILVEDRIQEINLPRPYIKNEMPSQHQFRKTEPDLIQNNYRNEIQRVSFTKRPLQSQYSHQDKFETQVKNSIKTFFQVTEQQKNTPKVNPSSSERQNQKTKNSISPGKASQSKITYLKTEHQSTTHQRDKSAPSQRTAQPIQLQDQRSDLLKLLQRNVQPRLNSKDMSFYKKQSSSNKITIQNTQQTQNFQNAQTILTPQDPIISQLIKKLQQGNNSDLFQQLVQLTNMEKFRVKAQQQTPYQFQDLQQSTNRIQRGNSLQQSLIQSGRQTQRSAQQSSSNLSSLLRPNVNTSLGKQKSLTNSSHQTKVQKPNRSKRVNSQNMESNPFHLNLDRINITTAQQKIQTTRETIRDGIARTAYQESILSSKRVRSRGSINTQSAFIEQQKKVARNKF